MVYNIHKDEYCNTQNTERILNELFCLLITNASLFENKIGRYISLLRWFIKSVQNCRIMQHIYSRFLQEELWEVPIGSEMCLCI